MINSVWKILEVLLEEVIWGQDLKNMEQLSDEGKWKEEIKHKS